MPISRATQQGQAIESGSSAGDGKHSSRSSRRYERQQLAKNYSQLREKAQLAGLIPTLPEESLQPERVDKRQQSDQPLPELVARAIRAGWATPDDKKPELVDELVKIIEDMELPAKVKVAAFNALRMADQTQYERDHPEVKGAGGGAHPINVSVTTNIAAVELLNKMQALGPIDVGETPRLEGVAQDPLEGEQDDRDT